MEDVDELMQAQVFDALAGAQLAKADFLAKEAAKYPNTTLGAKVQSHADNAIDMSKNFEAAAKLARRRAREED